MEMTEALNRGWGDRDSQSFLQLQQERAGVPPFELAEEDVARVYAQGGTGARDPRTGAVVPRFKDAMRGGLDPLLQAWRRRGRATG